MAPRAALSQDQTADLSGIVARLDRLDREMAEMMNYTGGQPMMQDDFRQGVLLDGHAARRRAVARAARKLD